MPGYVTGIVAAKNSREAGRISNALVKEKLAACCNTIPGVKSVYRYDGKVRRASEVIVMFKTRKPLTSKVIDMIKKHHSYDVPAIEFFQMAGGNLDSLKWVNKETR